VIPDLHALLDHARQVTDQAEQQLRTRRPSRIEAKGDRDMLTDVDLAIERLARDALPRRAPGTGFLGEEEGGRTDMETYWIIDPVDGTANFIRGLPLCGISLALVHQGAPVLGVISLPFLDRRYWAADGLGAWRNGRPIRAASTSELSEAMIAVGDYGTGDGAGERNRTAIAVHARLAPAAQRVRMLGSAAVDLALVADGSIDASITLGNRSWDMAAGAVIARAAGALVIDSDGTDHTLASRATIAVAPALRASILDVLDAATADASHPPSGRSSTC
jgi:myo-inositol-1(or 4)-monophosphatase